MIQKAFEVGNSTVLTIPKTAGIEPGSKFKFSKQNHKLIFELLSPTHKSEEDNFIEKTSGAFKFKVKSLKEVLQNLRENPYEK